MKDKTTLDKTFTGKLMFGDSKVRAKKLTKYPSDVQLIIFQLIVVLVWAK